MRSLGELKSLLFLFLELQTFLSVCANYNLQVRVHRYLNQQHSLGNGVCCNNYGYPPCYSQCSNKILFCLRPIGTHRDAVECSLAGIFIGRIFNDYVEIDDPITLSVQGQWTGTFQLVMDVYNFGFNLGLVDALYFEPSIFPVQDSFTTGYTVSGTYHTQSVMATLSFKVQCGENYYGDDCTTYCTSTTQYSCGSNGEHVCNENYYNPPNCSVECIPTEFHSCDSNGTRTCSRDFFILPECTVECISRNDDSGHFTCSPNGTKTCLDGYYGNNCTIFCEEEFGVSRCDLNGSLICEDGYYGDECAVYCMDSNDTRGYYICDNVTGEKLCLERYIDPSTNCTTPAICSTGPCLNGGRCVLPGPPAQQNISTNLSFSCECSERFSGVLCEDELVVPTITFTSSPDVSPEVTGVGVENTSNQTNAGTIVAVVLVVLALVISTAVLTVVIVICVSWKKRTKLRAINDGLSVRMLDVQHSYSDGIPNPCYLPQTMGVVRGHSDTAGSETHDFDNPLYQSNSDYSYPTFVNTAQSAVPAAGNHSDGDSTYSGSGVYSTIDHRRQDRVWALRQSVAMESMLTENVDFRAGVDLQALGGDVGSTSDEAGYSEIKQ